MESIILKFYEAFQQLDGETMASFYHEDIVFEDPAFGQLHGERAGNMWRMLCESQRGKDFQMTFSDISYKNEAGHAHWEADYTFSQTGRKIHNVIDARFTFRDGKIFSHVDTFNLHKWARQALGFQGLLLGGTGFFRKKLHEKTNKLLDKYEATLIEKSQ